MISYLKDLLVRLQSPESKKRDLRTEKKRRGEEQNKLKTQETVAQIRRSKANIEPAQTQTEKKMLRSAKKPERAKFQTIDLNSENRPVLQSARANVDYQKIRRRSQNQYEIEIAHEKDILQQLIRGTSANKSNSQNYYSNRNPS